MRKLLLIVTFVSAGTAASIGASQRDFDAAIFALPFSIQVHTRSKGHRALELPIPVKQSLPDYPIEMRLHSVAGQVDLRVEINRMGLVQAVQVMRASYPPFAAAAKKAVLEWKFLPIHDNGTSDSMLVDYTFDFRISITEAPSPRE